MAVYVKKSSIAEYLYLDFIYDGERCRESTGLLNTSANWKKAERKLETIKEEMHFGVFDYAKHFPKSKRLKKLGICKPNIVYFKDLAAEWLARQEKRVQTGQLKLATYNNYRQPMEYLIIPHFGEIKITNITRSHVEDFISEKLVGASSKHISNIMTPIRGCFDYAHEKELVEKDPTKRIRNPRQQKPDSKSFTPQEVEAILRYSKKHSPRFYAFFVVLFRTGIRVQEALVMKWENLDIQKQTYFVKETLSGKQISTTTKTAGSRREILLLDEVIQVLGEHRKTCKESEFIFPTLQCGYYTSSRNIYLRVWNPMLEALQMPHRLMRHSRHTFAIQALNKGIRVELVAKQLGHASLQMVFQKYAKYTESHGNELAEISRLIS